MSGLFRAICLAGVLGAAATAAKAAPTQTVVIDNFMFKPMSLTVAAGTHVVFENHDDLPHTVFAPELKLRSQMLDTDDKYEAVMDKPGKYTFFLLGSSPNDRRDRRHRKITAIAGRLFGAAPRRRVHVGLPIAGQACYILGRAPHGARHTLPDLF